jgi:hypothetical protein
MGEVTGAGNVLRILAAFSRYPEALDWTAQRAEKNWGKPILASPVFLFQETDYYTPSMGAPLQKAFWAFSPLAEPAGLADWKQESNRWETEYAAVAAHDELRPLNIDPGYLTLGKLVLASTKDHAHRIYLHSGIYAEITLAYRNRSWQPWDWTYPDYRRPDFQAFFSTCRDYLHSQQQEPSP